MTPQSWAAVRTTLELASATTLVLLVIGTPLAWWLAHTRSRLRAPVEAVTTLPLVLPPTVLGFYLLVLLAPTGPIGAVWQALGGDRLVFSFTGLLIGSTLHSLPFAVQPLRNAFRAIGREPLEAAATLGASPLDRFLSVGLPLARRGFVSAGVLTFAHTVGEFGVVLMIGGNIPGRTEVISTAIYNHVEAMEYGQAHVLAAGVALLSFVGLLLVHRRGTSGDSWPK